ncbi:hypothetical protein GCM10011505_23540 [Tistrella bauzanensis]|uniref:Uncharacterized protein n=1 Tax=Tistrella bauzanensis TaxID=657419 RepID=A0ABQ1IJV6_9PROT|nr:hypothetical protein GCM10011505_23540 [Tistrella bauzanensis]
MRMINVSGIGRIEIGRAMTRYDIRRRPYKTSRRRHDAVSAFTGRAVIRQSPAGAIPPPPRTLNGSPDRCPDRPIPIPPRPSGNG